jgi:hypothetical protein
MDGFTLMYVSGLIRSVTQGLTALSIEQIPDELLRRTLINAVHRNIDDFFSHMSYRYEPSARDVTEQLKKWFLSTQTLYQILTLNPENFPVRIFTALKDRCLRDAVSTSPRAKDRKIVNQCASFVLSAVETIFWPPINALKTGHDNDLSDDETPQPQNHTGDKFPESERPNEPKTAPQEPFFKKSLNQVPSRQPFIPEYASDLPPPYATVPPKTEPSPKEPQKKSKETTYDEPKTPPFSESFQSEGASVQLVEDLYRSALKSRDIDMRLQKVSQISKIRERFKKNADIACNLVLALNLVLKLEPMPEAKRKIADQIGDIRSDGFKKNEDITRIYADALLDSVRDEKNCSILMNVANKVREIRHDGFLGVEKIALNYATVLFYASLYEPDPGEVIKIIDRIHSLRKSGFEKSETIAMLFAEALACAVVRQPSVLERQKLLLQIEAVFKESPYRSHPVFAGFYAKALYGSVEISQDPQDFLKTSTKFDALRQSDFKKNEPVALELAKLISKATEVEPDLEKATALAQKIDELRKDGFQKSSLIREQYAICLSHLAPKGLSTHDCLSLTKKIEELHREDFQRSEHIAAAEAKTLFYATVYDPDPTSRMQNAEKIQVFHQRFPKSEPISEYFAQALSKSATGLGYDACLDVVDQIDRIRRNGFRDNNLIAEMLAMSLNNLSQKEMKPDEALEIAERISSLRSEGFENNESITLNLVDSLCHVTDVEPRFDEKLKIADRIEHLREHDDTSGAEVYMILSRVLYPALDKAKTPYEKEEVSERISRFTQLLSMQGSHT